ncbi:MAG: hypothetical protein JSU85_00710 [Candidatus Zixiibacteriota bacterium]|nr:MAG: hypothetical protein JSU85_00710 [candidate division Zixibacteria bacterium]
MMFAYFNIFDFFSRYTFRGSYSSFGNSYQPDINQTPSQISTDLVPTQVPETEQPAPVEETPLDTIEISGETPETAEENPVYTPEDIVPAEDTPEEVVPTNEEPTGPVAPHDNGLVSQVKSWAKLNLSMIFNLAEFDAVVGSFAEDAEDGQIDTISYTDLSIGLHAELEARARVKEMYRDMEGPGGPLQYFRANQRLKSSEFEAAMMRTRGFEADMFYRDSLKTSYKIRESYRNGFLKVSRKLHVRYTQDFGLNLRALNLFNGQAEALNQAGNLDSYLGNTETLVDSPTASGALLESFFDTVQRYLDGAEDKFLEKINFFFENLASEMGVETSSLQGAQEILTASIGEFFDRVDGSIELTRNRYLPPSEEPPAPELPENPEEPIIETAEADAAA